MVHVQLYRSCTVHCRYYYPKRKVFTSNFTWSDSKTSVETGDRELNGRGIPLDPYNLHWQLAVKILWNLRWKNTACFVFVVVVVIVVSSKVIKFNLIIEIGTQCLSTVSHTFFHTWTNNNTPIKPMWAIWILYKNILLMWKLTKIRYNVCLFLSDECNLNNFVCKS